MSRASPCSGALMAEVNTGSRLHLGFYRTTGGRLVFASIGIAIKEPSFRALVRPREGLAVSGPQRERISRLAEEVVRALGVPGARVEVRSVVPAHVGLGSTTQVKLGLAWALNALYGLGMTVRELAFATGRGLFSGIGMLAFEAGGLIVDTGRREVLRGPDDLPKPLVRLKVPGSWRFLLLVREGMRGLSEEEEREILLSLEPMPPDMRSRIMSLLFDVMLPSALWDDIASFGRALTEIQELMGRYFSPYQGGVFLDEAAEELRDFLISSGAHGVGQSSWGPTLYALTTEGRCRELKEAVRAFLGETGLRYEVLVAEPRNEGAKLTLRPSQQEASESSSERVASRQA